MQHSVLLVQVRELTSTARIEVVQNKERQENSELTKIQSCESLRSSLKVANYRKSSTMKKRVSFDQLDPKLRIEPRSRVDRSDELIVSVIAKKSIGVQTSPIPCEPQKVAESSLLLNNNSKQAPMPVQNNFCPPAAENQSQQSRAS